MTIDTGHVLDVGPVADAGEHHSHAHGDRGQGSPGSAERILVDVSGQLRLIGTLPTGIPRVEQFIIRSALRDPDPLVTCVCLDPAARTFRPVGEEHIACIEKYIENRGRSDDPKLIWADARTDVRNNPLLGKCFDRAIARDMVRALDRGNGRPPADPAMLERDWRYHYYKNKLRFFRLGSYLANRVLRRGKGGSGSLDGRLLVSHLIMSSSYFPIYADAADKKAFVFHDNIPLDHAEYLADNSVLKDENKHEKIHGALRRGDSIALCASDFARKGLESFDRRQRSSGKPIAMFPMPSTLYLKAARDGRAERLQAPQPFILYCSTVEVRKNHILLARIWKDALDRGQQLPPLYCVGKWGWRVDELSRFMDANPRLSGHIRFLGQIPDDELIDLYRSALFAVFPSFLEGWGLSASEALDFGLPIVVSTAPALREATRGLMPAVDPRDQEAWYRQIVRLAEDELALVTLRAIIRDNHRPVTESESWQAIKEALRNPAARSNGKRLELPEPAR